MLLTGTSLAIFPFLLKRIFTTAPLCPNEKIKVLGSEMIYQSLNFGEAKIQVSQVYDPKPFTEWTVVNNSTESTKTSHSGALL